MKKEGSAISGHADRARAPAAELDELPVGPMTLYETDLAARLGLSVRTVDNHLQNVYGKLGVTSRDELAQILRS